MKLIHSDATEASLAFFKRLVFFIWFLMIIFDPFTDLSGLPVIATDVGGNSELVENRVTGSLVPAGDEIALANAMKDVIQSADWTKRAGAAGRRKIMSEYSIEHMMNSYMNLYHAENRSIN